MFWNKALRCLTLIVLAAVSTFGAGVSAEPLVNQPKYDPETGSYFELLRIPPGSSANNVGAAQATWTGAAKLASSRMYKGIQGRLAIIKSSSTHEFIAKTFHLNGPAWFGLRYLCNERALEWSDGTRQGREGYSRWHRIWKADGYACSPGEKFAPIAYEPTDGVLYWRAFGRSKEFLYALIEYPASNQ